MTDRGRWADLKTHRLFRIATVYALAGWLAIQAADIVLEAFEAPTWVMRAFLVLVLAGFPLLLTGVWLMERAKGGPGRSIGSLVVIALALLASIGGYVYFASEEAPRGVAHEPAQRGRLSNPVLAVLPFVNMSSAEENQYLAEGMTEDIITLLAQSPGVEVISRNSTFRYKGESPDIRDVGRDLGADYVIEGSLRPVGDRFRVTVQVIESHTGSHVWAEQYDRPLEEFFDVQDEVSLGIAAAVGDAVFREEYSQIAQSRTANLTAWALTTQAEGAFHYLSDDGAGASKARRAVELDPDYALAHAVLGRALAWDALLRDDRALSEEAEREARLAARLSPNDPKVVACLVLTLLLTGQPEEALPYGEQLVERSPGYVEGLAYYADVLIHNGHSREAIPYLEKGVRLTPNAPQVGMYQFLLGEALMHHGAFAAAEERLLESNRHFESRHQTQLRYLAGAQLRLGKVDEALSTLERAHDVSDRPIEADRDLMAFISVDGGGEHFTAVWADLERLWDSRGP